MGTRSSLWFVPLAALALAGCAAQQPAAVDEHGCGSLPQPFTPPFMCLRPETPPPECFPIVRDAGPQGGLRIPPQIVCPE